jgi:hypothetical protein
MVVNGNVSQMKFDMMKINTELRWFIRDFGFPDDVVQGHISRLLNTGSTSFEV